MARRTTAVLLLVCASAWARDPDGALALIRTPSNTAPALVRPGDTFDVTLRREARLRLVAGERTFDLPATWIPGLGDTVHGTCRVPADVPPGMYALETASAEGDDATPRAVHVVSEFPATYTVAHLADPRIGAHDHARSAEAIFRDVLEAVNASDAHFAIISGALTEHGEPGEFRAFLDAIDTCAVPTFVCPTGRAGLSCERAFGARSFAFSFGEDGYLAFDVDATGMLGALGRQAADLQRLRRRIKPARWSIGFTHRIDPRMALRNQIALFIDNPLDCVLTAAAGDEPPDRVAWGTTRLAATPASANGSMRLFDVAPQGIRPREPERVARLR